LDPALLLVERLVRQDAETQLFRVERYGLVLVLDRDACKFDAANHSECTSVDPSTSLRISPGGLDAAKTAQDPSTSLRISPGGLDAAKTAQDHSEAGAWFRQAYYSIRCYSVEQPCCTSGWTSTSLTRSCRTWSGTTTRPRPSWFICSCGPSFSAARKSGWRSACSR